MKIVSTMLAAVCYLLLCCLRGYTVPIAGHSSPLGLVSLHVFSPPTFVMHPASDPYPTLSSCPLHISYQVSGLSLPCHPVIHIYLNPTKMNPSTINKPHI